MSYQAMWEDFYKRMSRSKKQTFSKGDIMIMMTNCELELRRKMDKKEVTA